MSVPDQDLRELFYGDVPLSQWASRDGGGPWELFRQAGACLDNQDEAGAREALTAVLATKNLESRLYLQAWDGLRGLGVAPSADEAKHVYGVVLDVPMPEGRDTLAAYEDGSCRYVNFSGRVLVWDAPDPVVGGLVAQLLAISTAIAPQIGPWEGPRPPVPESTARLSFLCPSGLHFGQGPLDLLQADPMAGRAFDAGAALLQELMNRAG